MKSSVHRTQHLNRADAVNKLKAKLLAVQQDQEFKNLQEIKGDHVAASFGSQIRNYVFDPYKVVKDVRTGYETSQVGLLDHLFLTVL
jgi:protein subunit release factor B